MISKEDAKRVYPRNTTVINKGDRGWKSDAGPELELAERIPGLDSTVRTARAHRPRADDPYLDELPDPTGLEVGSLYQVVAGRDLIVYEARVTGWHKRFTERNGAL